MVPSKPEKVRAAQLRCRTLLAEEEARLPILPISAGLQVRLDWLSVRLDWLSVQFDQLSVRTAGCPVDDARVPDSSSACPRA